MAAEATTKALDWNARVRSLAGGVKDTAVCVADYARKNASLRNIGRRVSKTVRKNPMQAVLVGAAIGLVGGMFLRRR